MLIHGAIFFNFYDYVCVEQPVEHFRKTAPPARLRRLWFASRQVVVRDIARRHVTPGKQATVPGFTKKKSGGTSDGTLENKESSF
jgi:hypothetical protein